MVNISAVNISDITATGADPTPYTREQCVLIGNQVSLNEWVLPLIVAQLVVCTWLLMQLRRSGYAYDGKYWGVVVVQLLIVAGFLTAKWGV